jgi:hypothetical protein
VVWDEAENRLHAQKALLVWLLRQQYRDADGGTTMTAPVRSARTLDGDGGSPASISRGVSRCSGCSPRTCW